MAAAAALTRFWPWRMLALAALVAAALGVRIGTEWVAVDDAGVDLVVAVDVSRSMLVEDEAPSRLARARADLVELLGALPSSRIGLVAFAGGAVVVSPLSSDRAALAEQAASLAPPLAPWAGGSDLGAAIDAALPLFEREGPSPRVLLVATDGEDPGGPRDLGRRIDALREAGVVAHAVVYGTHAGGPVPASEDPGAPYLRASGGGPAYSRASEAIPLRLTDATGGRTIVARPMIELAQDGALEARRTRDGGAERRQPRDLFRPLAMLALALLGVAALLDRRRARRTSFAALGGRLLLVPLAAFAGGVADATLDAFARGDFVRAAEGFERALAAEDARELAYDAGLARLRAGDPSAALPLFERATPGTDDLARRARFGAGVARARIALGRPDDAASLGALEIARRELAEGAALGLPDAARDVEAVWREIESRRAKPPANGTDESGSSGTAEGTGSATAPVRSGATASGAEPQAGEFVAPSAPPPGRRTADELRAVVREYAARRLAYDRARAARSIEPGGPDW